MSIETIEQAIAAIEDEGTFFIQEHYGFPGELTWKTRASRLQQDDFEYHDLSEIEKEYEDEYWFAEDMVPMSEKLLRRLKLKAFW